VVAWFKTGYHFSFPLRLVTAPCSHMWISLNVRSALRIVALVAMAIGCAWGVGQYVDKHAFDTLNADAIAVCESLTPGMPVADAEARARKVSGSVVKTGERTNGRLLIKIVG
jgi:hypothetical protein